MPELFSIDPKEKKDIETKVSKISSVNWKRFIKTEDIDTLNAVKRNAMKRSCKVARWAIFCSFRDPTFGRYC